MKNRKTLIAILVMISLISALGLWLKSMGYQIADLGLTPSQHKLTHHPEYLKLVQVMEKFSTYEADVIIDGRAFPPKEIQRRSARFMLRRFKESMTAEEWINLYCYQSRNKNIIYFKYPDGRTRPVRDVLIEALKSMT